MSLLNLESQDPQDLFMDGAPMQVSEDREITKDALYGGDRSPQKASGVSASTPVNSLAKDIQAALEPQHSLVDLRPANTDRPLSWRWELAILLARGSRIPWGWADEQVRQVSRFIEAFCRCRDDADRVTLAARWPNVFNALGLHLGKAPHARNQVQAYLLAGESHEQVAKRMAMHPSAIRWYERLFFDFRPYRGNQGLMTHRVIETHKLLNLNIGALWRYVGYWYGAQTLDLLMDSFDEHAEPRTPAQVITWTAEEIQSRLRLRVMVYSLLVVVDESTAPMLLRLHYRARKLLGKSKPAANKGPGIETNIRAMLDNLPWQPRKSDAAHESGR